MRRYVGRWLALELSLACPQAAVVAFDVARPDGSHFADLFDDAETDVRARSAQLRAAMNRVQVVKGSIISASDLNEACRSCDVVFNAAAYGMASVNGASLDLCRKINVAGVAALIDACAKCRVRRLVHVSSTVAVFDGSPIVNGTARLPLVTEALHGNHYGATKALAEKLLRAAPADLEVVIVRPNGIFGPNDNTHFPRLKRLLRSGLFNLKVGDGRSLVDWIFIDNLTHALLLAAAAPLQSRLGVADSSSSSGGGGQCLTVHVSDEDPREMNHLFCAFAAGLGYPPPSIYISTSLLARVAALMVTASHLTGGLFTPMLTPPEAYKAGTHMVFSTADARRAIGWTPIVSYDDGIKMTLEYEHRTLLRGPPPRLEVPSLLWWLLIVGGMWLCWVGDAAAAAAASQGESGSCGLPSLLCVIILFGSKAAAALSVSLKFIFHCALVAHAVEALVAAHAMLRMKAVAAAHAPLGRRQQHYFDWGFGLIAAYCLQTFILGFPSLKLVLRYSRLQQAMVQTGAIGREARGEALM